MFYKPPFPLGCRMDEIPKPSARKLLVVARPVGFSVECPELGTWLASIALRIAQMPQLDMAMIQVSNCRPALNRNAAALTARRHKADYLLMVDPDMAPDRYLRPDGKGGFLSRMCPFLPTALDCLVRHPGSVVGAPYCAHYPLRQVQVFHQGRRVQHSEIPQLDGLREVDAIGTGLMLIDMAVLANIPPPVFEDEYRTPEQAQLSASQDVVFCRKVRQAGGKVFCLFDCWAGHQQTSIVDPPGFETIPQSEQTIG